MSTATRMGRPRLSRPVSPDQIREVVSGLDTAIEMKRLDDHTRFVDAGADSLDFFNIVAGLQEAADITVPNEEIEQVATIQGAVDYLNQKLP